MSHLDFFDISAGAGDNRDMSGPTWNQWDHDSMSVSAEPEFIYPGNSSPHLDARAVLSLLI